MRIRFSYKNYLKNKETLSNIVNNWQYDGPLPKYIAFYLHLIEYLIESNLIFIKGFIISKAEYYFRPITYRLINYSPRYKLRHWSKVNRCFIMKRWWNYKYLTSLRLHNERYKRNMKIIAQMSEDTNTPQHVLLAQYKDLGQWNITYRRSKRD